MLRLKHNQTVQGPIYINDIDDGIPNKTAKHGTGDPDKYHRDGNSLGGPDKSVEPGVNWPKQKCYIPRTKPGDSSVAGYIDILETDRVLMSQYKGVIAGFQGAGLITVTSFTAADVAAPTVTAAEIDSVTSDLVLGGTNFTSLAPNISRVILTGTGAVTLTQAQIVAGGGTFTATAISIPAALVPGISDTSTFVQVSADDQLTTARPLIEAPVVTSAVISNVTGDLAVVGTNFTSISPAVSSVILTGTGAVTLTRAQIVAGGGTFTDTAIAIPAALVPGIVDTSTSIQVSADGETSTIRPLIQAPLVTSAVINSGTGDLALVGTNFTSISPAVSSVILTGTGAVTLTQAQIVAGGGTFTDTAIAVPAALVPGIVDTSTSVQVSADGMTTTARPLIEAPVVTAAQIDNPGVGDLTITGTDFTSIAPTLSSVIVTGSGAVTLTQTQITTGGGTISATSIVIPAALVPGLAATTSSVQISADGLLSNVFVVTV